MRVSAADRGPFHCPPVRLLLMGSWLWITTANNPPQLSSLIGKGDISGFTLANATQRQHQREWGLSGEADVT